MTMPGTTAPRNGMPESRDYVYRGMGVDTLTARLSDQDLGFTPDRNWRGPRSDSRRCRDCGYVVTGRNHRKRCG